MRLPTEPPPAAAGSRTNSSRRCWPTAALPLPPAKLEQLFLDEELHAPGHRIALDALHDWQLDWSAVWADAMRQWRPANWVWPSPSWTGSRAGR